ncbi:arylesterase [Reichenbachiella sp. MALMAid0571]|uniref:arylesterase n=1 Tax=Reichenbachiella sp. MALMAid0571 TaxID=3143939 RepID=UPI0032DF2AAB
MTIKGFSLFLFFLLLFGCQQKENQSENNKTVQKEQSKQPEVNSEKKVIVFFGNSIIAGYQLDLSEAFPAIIGGIVDSLGLDYRVVNAGLSGETTASGNSRVDWVLKNKVDVFVLELGANDGLRGIQTTETRKNLQSIIDKVKNKYPSAKIVLAGMQIPPNLGQEYANDFKTIYPELAEKNNTTLIPFILEGVAGIPELNLDDGIHPTPEGHKILAENIWGILKPLL